MKYVLVNWTVTNETSVLEESCVRDASMLSDPNKKGMIYFKEIGKKAPKAGWQAYPGRVVSVHGKFELMFFCRRIKVPICCLDNLKLMKY